MFGRVANVVLLVLFSKVITFIYAFYLLVLFVVVPFPPYVGHSNYKYLTSQSLACAVQETAAIQSLAKDKNVKASETSQEANIASLETVWVVLFFTTWSGLCVKAAEEFSELSYKYITHSTKSNAAIKFGKVDVGRHTLAAKKYNIDTCVRSRNLPTFIVFRHGRESLRMPAVGELPCEHMGYEDLANVLGLPHILIT
eukprot:CFRG3811T1